MRGAATALPNAAVSSPGEGKLAEKEEDHEAEFLGVSWRCSASKEGRILEIRLSCRAREGAKRGESSGLKKTKKFFASLKKQISALGPT